MEVILIIALILAVVWWQPFRRWAEERLWHWSCRHHVRGLTRACRQDAEADWGAVMRPIDIMRKVTERLALGRQPILLESGRYARRPNGSQVRVVPRHEIEQELQP